MILCQKRIRISTARHRVSATAFTPVKFLSQNLQVKPIPPPLARRCIDRTYPGCRPGLVIDDHGQRGIRHRQKVEALWQCGVPVFLLQAGRLNQPLFSWCSWESADFCVPGVTLSAKRGAPPGWRHSTAETPDPVRAGKRDSGGPAALPGRLPPAHEIGRVIRHTLDTT